MDGMGKKLTMRRWLIYSVLVLSMCGSARGNEYRTFTSDDGREIEARLVEYDAVRGRLKIERRGSGVIWVKPHVFSADDQSYIKEWAAASTFMQDRFFQVSGKKDRISKTGSRTELLETEWWQYNLTFKNRSKQPMVDLRVEYKYFIEHKAVVGSGDSLRVKSGPLTFLRLEPNQTITLSTPRARLDTTFDFVVDSFQSGSGSSVKTSEDKLLGLWIRVHGPEVEGTPLTRDFVFPKELSEKFAWEDKSTETTAPVYAGDYRGGFHKILDEGNFHMHAYPVELVEAKKSYEELKAYYDPKHETPTGEFARLIAMLAYKVRDYEGCVAWYETSLEGEGSLASRRELCALYSSGVKGITDGQKAIALGLELVSADPESFWDHDLLARAYARTGQYELAIKTQETSIELDKKRLKEEQYEANLRAPRERLELYKQGKPYYDRPPDSFS